MRSPGYELSLGLSHFPLASPRQSPLAFLLAVLLRRRDDHRMPIGSRATVPPTRAYSVVTT